MAAQKPLKAPGEKGKHVGRLNTPQGVRLEIARVYADARRGQLDTGDAYRLSLILGQLVKAIETSELAEEIETLKAAHAAADAAPRRLRQVA